MHYWQCMTVTRCSSIQHCHRMIRSASRRSVAMVATMGLLVVAMLVFWSHLRYPYRMPRRFFDYSRNTRRSRPNDASRALSRAHQNSTPTMYDVSQPFDEADFQCIRTITNPSATVCLFDVWRDVFISRSLQSAGIWEPYVVDEFIEAVRRTDVTAGVLDIGANIGYYTLLAARLGHRVVAVEPMLDSIRRLHRAAQIDHTAGNIQVVHNAVADIRTRATLRPDGDNQGDARIQLWVNECSGTCPTIINTVILDDLVDVVPFRQAVMKIDIQGYEHRAFQRADHLFRTIHFTDIFMEWMVMRDFYVAANHTSSDKQLVEHMIRFLFDYDYRPYKLAYEHGGPLDPADWGSWPLDIVWHRLPNDDEKSRLERSHFRNWPT